LHTMQLNAEYLWVKSSGTEPTPCIPCSLMQNMYGSKVVVLSQRLAYHAA
jgi:hypothetical protein